LRRAHVVCEVSVTLDRNLEFQQNMKILPFGIVVVRSRLRSDVGDWLTAEVLFRFEPANC
jgi:hypothetical protein